MLHIVKVKYSYLITVLFKHLSARFHQLARWIGNYKRCIALQEIWLYEETGFTGTGAAQNNHIKVKHRLYLFRFPACTRYILYGYFRTHKTAWLAVFRLAFCFFLFAFGIFGRFVLFPDLSVKYKEYVTCTYNVIVKACPCGIGNYLFFLPISPTG